MKCIPSLDPSFEPAILWNRRYVKEVFAMGDRHPIGIVLKRPDGTVSRWESEIAPAHPNTLKYVERTVKHLLWMKGGCTVLVSDPVIAEALECIFSPSGERAFDHTFMGNQVYGQPFSIQYVPFDKLPDSHERGSLLGRHLDGCRIGFDLGGSDRKVAAVIDGTVVYSEEIPWNPYFEKDPAYHIEGIRDSLTRAAAHLPRVDAIGGSAAGIYVDNEVRVASLFRGLSDDDFNRTIKRMFYDLKQEWGVPFEVVNDGEVTALAGSISCGSNSVLGISMGTSLAAGYVTPEGSITPWLNELAFAPIDYRSDAPVDEWSGDVGCGVQYFSQQGVARLAPKAGLMYGSLPFAEQLVEVQEHITKGDERAVAIYETLGTCFGYTVAHWADFYTLSTLLVLGRVTSGVGGDIFITKANEVLTTEFPALASSLELVTPSEHDKRHGQAIAAASLPRL